MGKMLKQCIKGIMLSMMSIATLFTSSFSFNANAVRITNIGGRTKLISALDHVSGSTIKGVGSKSSESYQNTNSDSFLNRNGIGTKWTCVPGAPLGTHEGGNEKNLQYIEYFPNGYSYVDGGNYGNSASGNNFPKGDNNNYFKNCVVVDSCRVGKSDNFTLPLNVYLCYNDATEKFFAIAVIPTKWDSDSYKNRGGLGSYGSSSYSFKISGIEMFNKENKITAKNFSRNGDDIFVTNGSKSNVDFSVVYTSEFSLDEIENLYASISVDATSHNKTYLGRADFGVISTDIVKGLKDGSLVFCNFEDYFNRPINLIVNKKENAVLVECPQKMNITMYDYKFFIEAVQVHLHNSVTGQWQKLNASNVWSSVAGGRCYTQFRNIDLANVDKIQADVYLTWEYYGKDSKKSWWSGEKQDEGNKTAYKYIIAGDLNFEEEEDKEEEELGVLVKTFHDISTYKYSGNKKVKPRVRVEYDEEEELMNVKVSHPITKELDDKYDTVYEYRLEKVEVLKGSKVIGESVELLKDDDDDDDEDDDDEDEENADADNAADNEEDDDDGECATIKVSDLPFKATDKISVRVYTSYKKTAIKKGKEKVTVSSGSYKFTESDETGKVVNTRKAKRSTVLKKTKVNKLFGKN